MKNKKIDIGTVMIALGVIVMAVSIIFYFKIKSDESAQRKMILEEQEKFKANLEAKKKQKPWVPDDYDVFNKHRDREDLPETPSNIMVDFEEETEEMPVYTVSTEGAVGFVEIPKLNLVLPLHPGTSNQSLNKGVGIMSEFDMPSEGRNSMSVIASHRGGRRGENTFLKVDKLNAGDVVKVLTDEGEIEYSVSKKEVVVPTDWSKFVRDENKATLVLLTCDPYPTNENRLLVFCERVYEPIVKEEKKEQGADQISENPSANQDSNAENPADPNAQTGANAQKDPNAQTNANSQTDPNQADPNKADQNGQNPQDQQGQTNQQGQQGQQNQQGQPNQQDQQGQPNQPSEEPDEEDPNADQQEMNKNPEDTTPKEKPFF